MVRATKWLILLAAVVSAGLGTAMARGVDWQDDLKFAIFANDLEEIKRLVAAGASLDPPPKTGTAPLASAAAFASLDVVKLLIELGADVNSTGDHTDPRTPLHHAGNRLEIAKLLLSKGADVNAPAGTLGTPFCRVINSVGGSSAASFEASPMIRLLLKHGANVNSVTPLPSEYDECLGTPLHTAVWKENEELVEFLIRHGADVELESHRGRTALECAREHLQNISGPIESIADPDSRRLHEKRLARLRALIEMLSNPEAVLATPEAPGKLSLLRAVEDGEVEMARRILTEGGPGADDTEQLTRSLWIALRREYFDLMHTLIARGADLDRKPDGATILMEVSKRRRADLVAALLELGTDPNLLNNTNQTALWYTLGCEPCMRLLLDHGADPNIRIDSPVCTILIKATSIGNPVLVRMLLDAGADPTIACDRWQTTALSEAKSWGHREIVQLLRQALGEAGGRETADADRDLLAEVEHVIRQLESKLSVSADLDLDLLTDELEDHLGSHPDDVDAIVLMARLTRVSPFAHAETPEAGEPVPEDTVRALIEKALELDRDHAAAHFVKGQLQLERVIQGETGYAVLPEARDEAIGLFRRAVELAPGELLYREALARALADQGRPMEGIAVLRASSARNHPMNPLLSDLSQVPIPDDARYLGSHILAMDDMIILGELGREDHLDLRLRVYEIHATAEEVTSFYRRYWPEFRFLTTGTGEDAGQTRAQYLRFKGDSVRFLKDFADLPNKVKQGMLMRLLQHDDEELLASMAVHERQPGQPLCFLLLINFRK